MKLTLDQLAQQLDLDFKGDANRHLSGVASPANAVTGDLCFLQEKKYLKELQDSDCSAVLVPLDFDSGSITKDLIFAENPHFSFVKAIEILKPELVAGGDAQQHASSQVAASAKIADGVSIGANAVIGDNVVIGPSTVIGAACIIEDGARVGADCQLHSRTTIGRRVEIGDRCILQSGSVLGSDGFGLVFHDKKWQKIPHIGTVIIEDDVEIGANTTVDRGALDNTLIEKGCKLDNLIQVAHNVRIGAHTAIAACVGIAGSASIGQYCRIAGGAGVLGHLTICDNVTVTAMSLVTKDIKKSGVYSSGTPLLDNSSWHKCNARYKSLDRLAKSIALLEKQRS